MNYEITNLRYKIIDNVVTYQCDTNIDNFDLFDTKNIRIEYPKNINLYLCDDCTLLMPFQILTWMIANLYNIKINLGNIDSNIYQSMLYIFNLFKKIYPFLNFNSEVQCNIIYKDYKQYNNSIIYFSGGLDSYVTLFRYYLENISLVNIQGINHATFLNLDFLKEHFKIKDIFFIVTNLRQCINEEKMMETLKLKYKGYTVFNTYFISPILNVLSAPICQMFDINKIYFSSSLDYRYSKTLDASIPILDNAINFINTHVYSTLFEYTRMERIKIFLNYCRSSNVNFPLKICFKDKIKTNCGYCYKCFLTELALLSEGADIKKYGFGNLTNDKIDVAYRILKKHLDSPTNINDILDIYNNYILNKITPSNKLMDIVKEIRYDFDYKIS